MLKPRRAFRPPRIGGRGPSPWRRRLRAAQAVMALCAVAYALLAMAVADRTGARVPDALRLRPAEVAPGLQLHRTKTRHGARCARGFGAPQDDYFARYEGDFCSKYVWEPQPNSASNGLHQVEAVFKVFDSEEKSQEYTWRFWGLHANEPIPSYLYYDVTATVPAVGQNLKALVWDPQTMAMPFTEDPVYNYKHYLYLFRVGHVFVKLRVSSTQQLEPTMMHSLATKLEARVVNQLPTPQQRRQFQRVQQINAAVGLHQAQSVLLRAAAHLQTQAQQTLDTLLARWAAIWQPVAHDEPANYTDGRDAQNGKGLEHLWERPLDRLLQWLNSMEQAFKTTSLENTVLTAVAVLLFMLAERLNPLRQRPLSPA